MHLMIDVETLGTRPGSVVTNIGIVAFDIEADGWADVGMEIPLNPQEQMGLGFKADWSTIRWWMDQSREAQALLPKVGFSLEVGFGAVSSLPGLVRSGTLPEVPPATAPTSCLASVDWMRRIRALPRAQRNRNIASTYTVMAVPNSRSE